ncbi:MAG TPA: DUF2935 domain-containing protein [Bacillota bacterium]
MSGNYEEVAFFEHRFWLQILGDHARFIMTSLSPEEKEEIQQAKDFMNLFDHLLTESRRPLTRVELGDLTHRAYEVSQALRVFKREIQRRLLTAEISINLTPTFISHMVNEVEDYLRILGSLSVGEIPPLCHPNYYHLLWLLDAQGHAYMLNSRFDSVEYQLIERARDFTKLFSHLYQKAIEINGYMRTSLTQFPAVSRFNHEAEEAVTAFRSFLTYLTTARMENTVLATFSPLVTDHMDREECYYLIKLAQVSAVSEPDSDPTRPRVVASPPGVRS